MRESRPFSSWNGWISKKPTFQIAMRMSGCNLSAIRAASTRLRIVPVRDRRAASNCACPRLPSPIVPVHDRRPELCLSTIGILSTIAVPNCACPRSPSPIVPVHDRRPQLCLSTIAGSFELCLSTIAATGHSLLLENDAQSGERRESALCARGTPLLPARPQTRVRTHSTQSRKPPCATQRSPHSHSPLPH